MGPAPFEQIQEARARTPQGRYVLGEQNHAKRQHPEPKKRKDAQDAAPDQQHTGWNPRPAGRGST